MVPSGLEHSASSSQVCMTHPPSTPSPPFDIIKDSGCTCHMMRNNQAFTTYHLCNKSYIILADKSRVPCLGRGTIQFILGGKHIIIHIVLHVPSL
jgi:hypothetical protein